MVTKEQVLESLRMVMDPELGINVVDLGLVYGVAINEYTIDITMTLTTPGCPLHESMGGAVRNVVQTLDLTKEPNVRLVWDPPWSPERMSQEAKKQLGWN